jgi:hypothetical protein
MSSAFRRDGMDRRPLVSQVEPSGAGWTAGRRGRRRAGRLRSCGVTPPRSTRCCQVRTPAVESSCPASDKHSSVRGLCACSIGSAARAYGTCRNPGTASRPIALVRTRALPHAPSEPASATPRHPGTPIRGERMKKQATVERLAGDDQARHGFEVPSGFRFRPAVPILAEQLQAQAARHFRVARDTRAARAERIARFEEDWFDPRAVILEVRRPSGCLRGEHRTEGERRA